MASVPDVLVTSANSFEAIAVALTSLLPGAGSGQHAIVKSPMGYQHWIFHASKWNPVI